MAGHRPDRRTFLLGLGAALAGCAWFDEAASPEPTPEPATPEPPPPPPAPWISEARAALSRGLDWLWGQQSDDGRFRSSTYGFFREGQSLTPFALDALLDVAAAGVEVDGARVAMALEAIHLMTHKGAVGLLGAAADYPVYATGLALSCWGRVRPPGWEDRVRSHLGWLLDKQLTGEEWSGHIAHGGFPMGGGERPTPATPGHVDLSMTRRALTGLRDAGLPLDHRAFRLGRRFVLACAGEGGGFVYSPVQPELNKGGGLRTGDPPISVASYGSATCDGLLALRAVTAGPLTEATHPRVGSALVWLRRHHRLDANPGVQGGPMEVFGPAMKGYYRAASSRVFEALGGPEGWEGELVKAVLDEQREDGSWANPSNLQKEDDPLVATPLALRAVARAIASSERSRAGSRP